MTILQLISSEGFYGAESMLVTLSESLSRLGLEVVVGVFEDRRNPHTEVAQFASRSGLAVRTIACDGRWDWRVVGKIRRLLDECTVDVLHAHGYKADFYAYMACGANRAALVSTCHNWPSRLKRMRSYAMLDRLLLKRFDKVTAPAPPVVEVLRKSGIADERLSWISNGVDVDRFDDAEPTLRTELNCDETPVVGFVGRLVENKGGAVLLRAAQQLLADDLKALFVFVGEGPARADWQALAESLGIARQVVFTGVRRDMPGVYASMDIAVLPSFDEAMPMCLLEAMAASKPVIATRVGAIREFIQDGITGILLEPGDVVALAGKIRRLLVDRDMRRKIGLSGHACVARLYSANAMGQKYLDLYKDTLVERKTGRRRHKKRVAP